MLYMEPRVSEAHKADGCAGWQSLWRSGGCVSADEHQRVHSDLPSQLRHRQSCRRHRPGHASDCSSSYVQRLSQSVPERGAGHELPRLVLDGGCRDLFDWINDQPIPRPAVVGSSSAGSASCASNVYKHGFVLAFASMALLFQLDPLAFSDVEDDSLHNQNDTLPACEHNGWTCKTICRLVVGLESLSESTPLAPRH